MLKRVCFCFSRNQSIFFDPYSMNTLYSFVRVCNNSRASNAYIQKYAGFHFLFAPSRPVARPKAGVFSLVLNIEKEKEKEGKERKNIKAQTYIYTSNSHPSPHTIALEPIRRIVPAQARLTAVAAPERVRQKARRRKVRADLV